MNFQYARSIAEVAARNNLPLHTDAAVRNQARRELAEAICTGYGPDSKPLYARPAPFGGSTPDKAQAIREWEQYVLPNRGECG